MATTLEAAAYCLDEKKLVDLRELVQGDDAAKAEAALEEGLRALLSKAADLEEEDELTPESWEWTEWAEALARSLAATMKEDAADIRRTASALAALRPGEAAFAAALRAQAALTDARRGDAERLLAATLRLQEKELRRLAAKEHLVDPGMAGFLGRLAGQANASVEGGGYVPSAEELAAAAGVLDAAGVTVEAFAAAMRRFLAAGSGGGSGGPASAGPTKKAFATAHLCLVLDPVAP